ncbi:hypothetical protein THIOKS12250068 [Thiocapsa sp. KS1]|jgi:hypothetical protein|nr:hypothetical protein [Thiocapsa sp. KS1]CRI65170.1 hypothetical protein THIOKS12250068 [Thiocapsa sp. KS1]
MSRILPLRSSWDPGPDDTSFYPDDLPEEWRLTYFANALDAVLLGEDIWRQADAQLMERWCRDVPDSFRFYLRTEESGEGFSGCSSLHGCLGERLGGWLVPPDRHGESDLRGSCYAMVDAVTAAADSRAPALACAVPDGLVTDLRAARAWLETYAAAARGRPALALMGQSRFEDVRRWQALVQLLGVG